VGLEESAHGSVLIPFIDGRVNIDGHTLQAAAEGITHAILQILDFLQPASMQALSDMVEKPRTFWSDAGILPIVSFII